jgi:hypothetical protein
MVTTWPVQVAQALQRCPTPPDYQHHLDNRTWAWEGPRCITIMTIPEDLKEEMMLAVCFTRCDAMSAIVGCLLNDTSVAFAHACILHTP